MNKCKKVREDMNKIINKIIELVVFSFVLTLPLSAQTKRADRFEHKIVAGFNLGATTPLPLPSQVRSVDSWWPQFTPQLGYSVLYKTTEQWGIGSGIMLNYKGMGVKDKVKYMYTRVVMDKNDGRELEGYFVGKNETRVKTAYVTVPVYASFRPHEKWTFRAGGYASYLFSGQFKGTVSDGYMRVGDPLGEKVEIEEASFDFNDNIRSFDFGLTAGAERKINDKFGVYVNLDWAITPLFPSNFKVMEFDLYNVYFTFGLTYRL